MLDCFTHTGSFALNAAAGGAASVLGVDASESGILQARLNAERNGMQERVQFVCRDVFDLLPELEQQGRQFDVVILDPPAFTKSRNSVKNAVKGYREINLARDEAGKGRRISGNLFVFTFYDGRVVCADGAAGRAQCTQTAAAGRVPDTGAGSSDLMGRAGILLSEVLHFPNM